MMNCQRYQIVLFPVVATCIGKVAVAQQSLQEDSTVPRKAVLAVGGALHHGFIFAHSPAVGKTKGYHPTGVEASFNWQQRAPAIFSWCNCYPRKGLLLVYYDHDSTILGQSATVFIDLRLVYSLPNSQKGAVVGQQLAA